MSNGGGVAPLVVYGEHDWVMSRDDHLMIAAFVNRRRPGAARYVEVPKMDHFYRAHDTVEASFRYAPGSRFPEEVSTSCSSGSANRTESGSEREGFTTESTEEAEKEQVGLVSLRPSCPPW